MIKCLFTAEGTLAPKEKRCNKPADYIVFGKSYCAEHAGFRSEEYKNYKKENGK